MSIQSANNGLVSFQSINPFKGFEDAGIIWRTLQSKCPHSYFTSWEWMSIWLKSLPTPIDVALVVGYHNGKPVLAFFVGRHLVRRHGVLPSIVMSVNSTANPYLDKLTIEHNSFVYDPDYLVPLSTILRHLGTMPWSELVISGASCEFDLTFNAMSAKEPVFHLMVDRVANSFFVDLGKVRNNGMDYLQLLSPNKRSQIRRSIKEIETGGKVMVRQASCVNEAIEMLVNLARLHERTWSERGESGAFSNSYFSDFHTNLIRERFCRKEIQLLHIFNAQTTIGYLYNFTYSGQVLFYQCGLNYSLPKNCRPGDISHYYAILHNAAQPDLNVYDFLAGDQQYKRTLSTGSNRMYWLRYIKGDVRYGIEKMVIVLKRRLLQARQLNRQ